MKFPLICSMIVARRCYNNGHSIAQIARAAKRSPYLRWYTKGEATWNSMRNDANVIAFLLGV